MKLTSISKVNIDATAASLPVSLRFICVDSIDSINTKIIVLIILYFFSSLSRQVYILTWYLKMNVYAWPGQEQLENFLLLSSLQNVYDSLGKHTFPWNNFVFIQRHKDMWQIFELRFYVWWQLDIGTEFISIQEFLPMFIWLQVSALEGSCHRIDLSKIWFL
jgi:hypothetical protein